MGRAERLGDEIQRIAADEPHRAFALQPELIGPFHLHGDVSRPHIVDRVVIVEQADEGRPKPMRAFWSFALPSSSALRPSKSRRLTSLPKVAPTVLPRLLAITTTSGSGLFQVDFGMDADIAARSDRRQHRRLGEDLGVGADAEPRDTATTCLVRSACSSAWRPYPNPAPSSANRCQRYRQCAGAHLWPHRDSRAPFPRSARSIMLTAKVTPARLDHLQVARRQQERLHRIARIFAAVGQQLG